MRSTLKQIMSERDTRYNNVSECEIQSNNMLEHDTKSNIVSKGDTHLIICVNDTQSNNHNHNYT